ncbi:MAG: class IV adenylate cyclase [Gemmatimonadaceae bacterium]
MRELELKAIVPELDACRERLMQHGAVLREAGKLRDLRYDTEDRALRARDVVLRVREFVSAATRRTSLDWKGPATLDSGYKEREEVTLGISDAMAAGQILEGAGFVVSFEIERDIEVFDVHGATVRIERYARMDTLVEVEGAPRAIEEGIRALGIPRSEFTTERLGDFMQRYEQRTGHHAAVSTTGGETGSRYVPADA